MLTYERSTKLRTLAKALPDEAFVLETDAPDLTGAEHQYSRNSPAYLPAVAKSLAEIRGISVEEIAAITTANAMKVLNLTAD
jgi:TatD DNase family protein